MERDKKEGMESRGHRNSLHSSCRMTIPPKKFPPPYWRHYIKKKNFIYLQYLQYLIIMMQSRFKLIPTVLRRRAKPWRQMDAMITTAREREDGQPIIMPRPQSSLIDGSEEV